VADLYQMEIEKKVLNKVPRCRAENLEEVVWGGVRGGGGLRKRDQPKGNITKSATEVERARDVDPLQRNGKAARKPRAKGEEVNVCFPTTATKKRGDLPGTRMTKENNEEPINSWRYRKVMTRQCRIRRRGTIPEGWTVADLYTTGVGL